MTDNRRIFLNIIATYGRSLYALIIGLFCGRWTLMSLGAVDYGLMGLVGGLAGFVSFFNSILANSVSRFFAVSVGASKRDGNESVGLVECRQWFNVALVVHVVLSVFLVAIGYPVGIWLIENFLSIPQDRVVDCIWVWRFTCISCFISMISVPFSAMYNAKQDIAELTIYSFVTTTINALFLYHMINNPGVWLAKFSCWSCAIYVMPQLIIVVRAFYKYSECRIDCSSWRSTTKYCVLVKFAFARFWTEFSMLISGQCASILVNKYCGPASNAAMGIGNTVAGHTATLSGSLSGAFNPAIANLCGEGKYDSMKRMCFVTCRVGALLLLVFAIPVALEINELLELWLKNPPPYSSYVCLGVLFNLVLNRMSEGYPMAIYSMGNKIMTYSWVVGWSGVSGVIVMLFCFSCGIGMWSIVINSVYTGIFTAIVRLILGERLVGFETIYWLRTVLVPITFVSLPAILLGCFVTAVVSPSFWRIVLTTIICEIIILPLSWIWMFNCDERKYILLKIRRFASEGCITKNGVCVK